MRRADASRGGTGREGAEGRVGKVVASPALAVAGIPDGACVACGGFGRVGAPVALMQALAAGHARDLEIVSNNGSMATWGLGPLLEQGRVRRVVATYIGGDPALQKSFLEGQVEIELNPQGTFVERLRAAGHGIAAFYTPTGVGTLVETGGLPCRHHPDGSVAAMSPAKEVREFEGRTHLLETALRPDYALVHAWRGDPFGNLVFRKSARNFNPVMAMAARVTIAEVEELVPTGGLDPDAIHLPGVFVTRLVAVAAQAPRADSEGDGGC